jgi:hypothetical protein
MPKINEFPTKLSKPQISHYSITAAPMRANKNRDDYMTFPTIDKNEASINAKILILNQIIDMLRLNSRDVQDSLLWISGNYLTVCNIARSLPSESTRVSV